MKMKKIYILTGVPFNRESCIIRGKQPAEFLQKKGVESEFYNINSAVVRNLENSLIICLKGVDSPYCRDLLKLLKTKGNILYKDITDELTHSDFTRHYISEKNNMFNLFDGTICMNNYCKKYLDEKFPHLNNVVIYHPYDTLFKTIKPDENKIPRIAYLGRSVTCLTFENLKVHEKLKSKMDIFDLENMSFAERESLGTLALSEIV